MRLAVVTWAIRPISSEAEFFDHMTQLVESAVAQGADTVILPESIDLERTQLFGDFRANPLINPTLKGSGHPEGEENLGAPIPSGSGRYASDPEEIRPPGQTPKPPRDESLLGAIQGGDSAYSSPRNG